MKVEKVDHIHIGVKDLDNAVGFFSDLFETTFSEILQTGAEQDTRGTVCDLGGVGLELFTGLTPDGWMSKLIEKRGEGFFGMSFKVPNIDEAIAEVEARGLRIVERVAIGNAIEAHIHPKDTYGTLIELVQYEAQHPGVAQALNKGYDRYRPEE